MSSSRYRGLLAVCICLVAMLAPTLWQPVVAATNIHILKRYSLEELMDLEVTTVSRQPQRYANVASALSVLTSDEIRRSGAVILPDALRYAPGLHVAQFSGRSYAISARGFNNLAANKMQVLMDGRSLYTPLFSGVLWEFQDTLLEDIDRIEVIRGPGATMWGANAVNGVINVITKPADVTQGVLLMSGGGTEERAFGGLRYGGKLATNTYYRVYSKYVRRDDQILANGHSAGDASHSGHGGFRIDSYPAEDRILTFQGDLYYNTFELRGRSSDAENHGGNLIGRWTQSLGEDSDFRLQAYYDRGSRFVPLQFEEDRDAFDLDLQHRFPIGDRQKLIWGLGYNFTDDDTEDEGTVRFSPRDRTLQLFSGFLQDEITLVEDRLGLIVGAKLEHNDFSGFELQPSVRLAWTPTPNQTVWTAVSRAVRTPTRFDEDLRFIPNPATGLVLIRGNRDFDSEELIAYELGYRVRPLQSLSLDVALFYNEYDRLRSQEPAPPLGLPLVLENHLEANTWGGELIAIYQPVDWWHLQGSYGLLWKDLDLDADSADPTGGALEGNDPHHIVTIRSSTDIGPSVEFDVALRYVDALPNPRIPSYLLVDVRLAWQPVENLELALVGQHLLDSQHPEFGSQSPTNPQVQHGAYGKLTWRF